MNQRSIAILGATGSIGTQALDLIRRYPERFEARCLVAGTRAEALFPLVREFRPAVAGLVQKPKDIPEDLQFCQWVFGEDCAARALELAQPQDALCAVVGIAGLDAVWTALDCCERVLLANKEALVTGGALVMDKARKLDRALLPVDSEHSAIFQCLQAQMGNPVRRLHLTCSGGALRTWTKAQIETASVSEVLAHPNWHMGAKITVDCATMMNKGLEVIEAHHLFHTPLDKICVVVHPQSVIHSMVEFEDGAILAQMGKPDMRGPIGVAMGFPDRLPYGGETLDFVQLNALTFEAPDAERFPCLPLAIEAQRAGGCMPVALNGANEEAVAAFLTRRIPFGAIYRAVRTVLDETPLAPVSSIEEVHSADIEARSRAKTILGRMQC
ncbi:MAG: 1-deoxy-D-xylulose-5-phosphate reductoisomerase [Clostridia bacterium]|nr:1-deoxy-D-xylulose-5-phosphate reductoisomerase [Clostridia bacterium]